MIQKIKQEIKTFFKSPSDIISFFLPIIIAIILLIPVSYTVTIGGGTLNIDKKINIDNSYSSKGSFASAYVKELNGTVGSYLLAKIIPSYELHKIEDVILENEEHEDYSFREKMYFTSSLDSALLVAFNKANKEIKIKDSKLYIVYVDSDAKTELKAQDQILEVNNEKISSFNDFTNKINEFNYDDVINIKVSRNNKEILCKTKILNVDNNKKIGIYLMNDSTYESNPKVDFDFTSKEEGPSGGLMIALSIYNKLTNVDITKGYKIIGTGTIDEKGIVGEIGGIKYKLKGAVNSKADIFICPKDNYEEALKEQKENDYKIKIISVDNFDDALNKLESLNSKKQ